jgi:hypothetical protein
MQMYHPLSTDVPQQALAHEHIRHGRGAHISRVEASFGGILDVLNRILQVVFLQRQSAHNFVVLGPQLLWYNPPVQEACTCQRESAPSLAPGARRAPRQAQVYQSAKRTNAQPGKTLPPPYHWGPHQCARLRTPYAAYTHTHTRVCVLSCARCAWWPMGASPDDLHVRQRVADLLEGEREAMRG